MMCVDCRSMATDHILDLVNKGYALDIAIRLTRDSVIKTGLMDRLHTRTIEDVQELFDIVTKSGEVLTALADNWPEQYEVALTHRMLMTMTDPS